MRIINWKSEIKLLLCFLIPALIIDWFFDILPWAILLVVSAYLTWTFLQLRRIHRWLNHESHKPPPYSSGIWGDIFDSIYRLERQNKEEKLRLQAAVDYLRDSFASLDDAAVMVNKRGNIEWSNVAAENLLGLRYPDDTDQQLVNLVRTPEFIDYFESRNYEDPLDMDAPKDPRIKLQVHVTFFGEGSRLMFARDITRTNKLMEMRTDFVANVSHELRTPLTVINGYLETLHDNDISDTDRLKRIVEQMLGQSHRMESLVKDLILLSRLETVPEAMEQHEIDILSLIESIRIEAMASGRGERLITIEGDSAISLMGNMDELRSAFTNLIINAVKYTEEGGHIHVSWYRDKNNAYLEVTDDGIGIDRHHLPRLTERFYRVDTSRSIDTGGTGLGLAIVKHVLMRHQGDLEVNSTIGEGSTFTCVFPLSRTVAQSYTA